jgi:hypothetical protein
MPMLEWPGVFTVPLVPDGWFATRSGNVFELQPPSNDASVHISLYERASTPLETGEAEAQVKKFVHLRPPEGDVQITSLPQKDQEQRAFAHFRNRADDGTLFEWFAGCILWPTAMLMCSCNAAPGNPALKQGEIMIASIFEGTESE